MRASKIMRRFLRDLQTHETVLSPKLSSVFATGFVEEKGCVLLASEAPHSAFTRAVTQDETGYECFINYLHVESLGDGLEFARRLNKRLAECFKGSFVVIVSLDGREATIRFHTLRADQTWSSENLEGYLEEGIAVLDSNCPSCFAACPFDRSRYAFVPPTEPPRAWQAPDTSDNRNRPTTDNSDSHR
jgi:hypothetical protein